MYHNSNNSNFNDPNQLSCIEVTDFLSDFPYLSPSNVEQDRNFDNEDKYEEIFYINKENVDPCTKMITPLKAKNTTNQNFSSRNTNRSPLQDITPPPTKKKIEVHGIQRNLIYPYKNGLESEEKEKQQAKFLR